MENVKEYVASIVEKSKNDKSILTFGYSEESKKWELTESKFLELVKKYNFNFEANIEKNCYIVEIKIINELKGGE